MKTQIRNLGIFLTVCYVILFAQLQRYTVFDAEELQEKPGNNRQEIRDFSAPRGTIATSDGVLLAESKKSDDKYKLQRTYPQGDLYAHIVGSFNPLSTGTSGVEKTYNKQLAGDLGFGLEQLNNLFSDENQVGNVTLTIRSDVQQAARDALAGKVGSVVALDPRNGEILAAYSNPTFDPNPLASHDFGAALKAADDLDKTPGKPRLARFYRDNLPPGSTFKVITSTAGITYDNVTNEGPEYPEVIEYTPRGAGASIRNSNGHTCGGTLFTILARSCNTSYAQMGEEMKGQDLAVTAADFGFDKDVPIDLPLPAQATMYCKDGSPSGPAELDDPAIRAQEAIGGRCVRATPLEMALVAAAVAHGGDIMKPHVLKEIRDNDGSKVKGFDEGVWTKAMEAPVAAILREAMNGVVEGGTADKLDGELAPDQWEVGGKTGTAPLGDTGSSHAWIIGFAGRPGEEPTVAVAAVIEAAPGLGEQFGGQVAGPVAAHVLHQVLEGSPTPAENASGDE